MTTLAAQSFTQRQAIISQRNRIMPGLRSWWSNRTHAERLAWQTASLMMALAGVTYLAMGFETRTLNGINVWVKPLKFQTSVAIHMATLALFVWAVAETVRQRWFVFGLVAIASVAAVFEIGYITLRAGQGVHSHFDVDTPFEELAYTLMGAGAVLLILVALLLALLVARRPNLSIGAGLKAGILWGGVIGFVSTLVVAGYLSGSDARFQGGLQDDSNGLPIVGWATDEGDLRVPHFFATHMFQFLPFVGLMVDRFAPGRVSMVWAAAVMGAALVAYTFWQALADQPFLALMG